MHGAQVQLDALSLALIAIDPDVHRRQVRTELKAPLTVPIDARAVVYRAQGAHRHLNHHTNLQSRCRDLLTKAE